MLDGRSRVTVVGGRRRADLALPSEAPIAEYSAALATLCEPGHRGALPAVWSLAVAGAEPLPLTASLGGAGVVDGQVLYLRDIGRDPGGQPVLTDLDELIAGEAERQRARDWPRPLVLLCFGLVWLVTAALLVPGLAGTAPVAAATVLVVVGLLLPATGWALAQQRIPVPAALCVLTSLAAVPCLAVAGALLAGVIAGNAFGWSGALVGATVAVLLSLAATPEALVAVLGLEIATAMLVSVLLVAISADGLRSAAATAVVALAAIGLARRTSALAAVWSQQRPAAGGEPATPAAHPPPPADALLARSRRLLSVLLAGPACALLVALPVLALSGTGYGLAMAGTGAVALLVRARQAGFGNEFVPLGVAGLAGLFGALVGLSRLVWPGGTEVTVVLLGAGLSLVATALITLAHGGEEAAELPPGFPPGAGRPTRRFVDLVGAGCATATVVLALGVFGVFTELAGMGRSMIGG
ncbi:EsaB/YukD family protein [Plantactinospora sp. KBS50]|uniref:EsaB/YukD family protein n=1 Tax=Plantactinospora sp. KBS50 TaxID=2024580 RepID=UPI000BAB19B5|nr:EsaB/YukD family protein [Plantactinospora sp. KBS50]ASW55401.1 hypothetical protein CIK06_16345 [Plantactinospora sp. KBS50]